MQRMPKYAAAASLKHQKQASTSEAFYVAQAGGWRSILSGMRAVRNMRSIVSHGTYGRRWAHELREATSRVASCAAGAQLLVITGGISGRMAGGLARVDRAALRTHRASALRNICLRLAASLITAIAVSEEEGRARAAARHHLLPAQKLPRRGCAAWATPRRNTISLMPLPSRLRSRNRISSSCTVTAACWEEAALAAYASSTRRTRCRPHASSFVADMPCTPRGVTLRSTARRARNERHATYRETCAA